MEKNQRINGQREGYWERFYDNGNLCFKGNYINGKEEGYWLYKSLNGKHKRKVYYII